MIHTEISPEVHFDEMDQLIKAAEAALEYSKDDLGSNLTIAIEIDCELQRLNRDFLGKDTPTDVLAFPANEFDPDDQNKYIGDVIISIDQAGRQAQSAGHPLVNELQLLVVHGVLHLLGYDHAEAEPKRTMWRVQAEILEKIGCKINLLPE